jgi:putative Mn2+ efflux pump MntP
MLALALIAIAVSMDATAVAAAYALRGASGRDLLKLAATFGAFQFAMALAGALGGALIVSTPTARYNQWVAAGLLCFVGAKMIREAFGERETPRVIGWQLLMLGVATSIDALAVGVSLPALGLEAWTASLAIGGVTFCLSLAGAHLGRAIGRRFGTAIEVAGGGVLIVIGLRALF